MKTNAVFIILLSALFRSEAALSVPTLLNEEVSNKQITQLSEETDLIQRRVLLLKTMQAKTETSDLVAIIKLHQNKSLTNDEFRTIFWNGNVSKELFTVLKGHLSTDTQLSNLDKVLINSITGDVAFDELLETVKKDTSPDLPLPLQSVLINELLKSYLKDFDQINNDEITLYEKLEATHSPEKNAFLTKLKKLMELAFFKRRLETKRLVSPKKQATSYSREITSDFSLSYNYMIGRCGTYTNTVKFSSAIASYGLKCPTETPSIANLNLHSKIGPGIYDTTIEVLLDSGVVGGYDRDHKEDATAILNYNLAGKIVIPKCQNPAYCNQIITISVIDEGRSYPNSNQSQENIALTVNGNNLKNSSGSYVSVDISKNDAVISINFSGNKKHIGACCSTPNSFQKVNLGITSGLVNADFGMPDEVYGLFTFQDPDSPFELIATDDFQASNLNRPPSEVQDLKNTISEVTSKKSTLDNYRHLFYTSLEVHRMHLDHLLKKNGDPLQIQNNLQLINSISDVIGRGMILPIINSKILGYQNSSILKTQKNINDMFKSILLIKINAENANAEISAIVEDKMPGMNADGLDLAQKFITALETHKSDHEELLNQISSFQTEFNYMTKSMVLEMELLNLEQAQFTELQDPK